MDNGMKSRATLTKRRERRNERIRAAKFGKEKNKAAAGTMSMFTGFGRSYSDATTGMHFQTKHDGTHKVNRQKFSDKAKRKRMLKRKAA